MLRHLRVKERQSGSREKVGDKKNWCEEVGGVPAKSSVESEQNLSQWAPTAEVGFSQVSEEVCDVPGARVGNQRSLNSFEVKSAAVRQKSSSILESLACACRNKVGLCP